MSNVIWKPQPKQEEFQKCSCFEALYGGAAGGGKSDALLAEALRQVGISHYRGIIFRRTIPQLEGLISRSKELYAKLGGKYNEVAKCWTFKSGAKIFFGYMQREDDKTNYQGKPYDFIGFDELTHFTWTQYSYMFSRCRPTGAGTRCYIRATANPGGVGHGWVKERFIKPCKAGKVVWEKQVVTDNEGKKITMWTDRTFIASSVFDNKALLSNDPNYLASLAMLPEKERDALLYGNWDSFAGQVFTEWLDDKDHYKDMVFSHVIEPFDIPKDWKVFRCMDWGFRRPYSVGWYAIDFNGRIYRIKELYGCTGTANEGVKETPQEVGKQIKAIEASDKNLIGRHIEGYADNAIFSTDSGTSISDSFEQVGVYWERVSKERLHGLMQCHYRLAFDEHGFSMFYCFNTCKNFIRTIPVLVYNETGKNIEDVDTEMEDHIYDEWRYGMMENPIPPRKNFAKQVHIGDDPLNLYKDRNNTKRYNEIN